MTRQQSAERDRVRLQEAEGWLELGGVAEALDQLNKISAAGSTSLDALRTRYTVLSAAGQWKCALLVAEVAVSILPGHSETWLWRAHAVRVLTQSAASAHEALSPAGERFPDDPVILLNLALYQNEMGHAPEATSWLQKTRRAAETRNNVEMVERLLGQDVQLQKLWRDLPACTKAAETK